VDLPPEEMYSPISRVTTKDSVESFFDEVQVRKAMAPGAFTGRVPTYAKIKMQSDVHALYKHIAEMEHYLAWSDKIKQLENIFSDNKTQNLIIERYGKGTLQLLQGYIREFRSRGALNAEVVNSMVDQFRMNFTVSVLAFNPAVMVKATPALARSTV